MMFDDLGIESIDFPMTIDIKMGLTMIGKPGGKPMYNCLFCDSKAPFDCPYHLYTLGDLFAHHQDYLDAGSPYKRQQEFQNIVNLPLLSGDPDQLVLGMLIPPPLHILLGVVDKHITSVETNVFPSLTGIFFFDVVW